MYEELRKEGESKSKAARIANASSNTSRKQVGKKGGKSPGYEDWSKSDLYNRAKDVGIEGRSSMDKQQLIKALRNSRRTGALHARLRQRGAVRSTDLGTGAGSS